MSWTLLLLAALGFLSLFLLLRRTPEPRGDQISAAYQAAAILIKKDTDSFRSGLRRVKDADLQSMVVEGLRMREFLEEEEKVLSIRGQRETLTRVRVDLQRVRACLEWMMEEYAERNIIWGPPIPTPKLANTAAPSTHPA